MPHKGSGDDRDRDTRAARDGLSADQDLKDCTRVLVRLQAATRRKDDTMHNTRVFRSSSTWPASGGASAGGVADAGALVRNSTSMKWSGVGPTFATTCV